MKKIYLLLLIVFSLGGATYSQYVTIPDAKFATYLHTVVPSAMSGNLLDTTNASVLSLPKIYVENLGIRNLSGVQYFKGLITLDCGNGSPSIDSNHITSLPPLPGPLDTLICGNNQISVLPILPGGLQVLKCYINKLDSLPALPNTLFYINCETNYIDTLPTLPIGLDTLLCDNNFLVTLPGLPSSLVWLDCQYNKLTNLPPLPNSLQYLITDWNQLDSLPSLNNGLWYLSCNSNYLTSLPNLPLTLGTLQCSFNVIRNLPSIPASLWYLDCAADSLSNIPALPSRLTILQCDANPKLTSLPVLPLLLDYLSCNLDSLTSLPPLPGNMYFLSCQLNQLTSLPTLPSGLEYLFCGYNKIACFPVFPSTLVDSSNFYIFNNPFNCLPNYVRAMDKWTLEEYPLCMPGNSNGCPVTPGIMGYTYEDMDTNCTRDSVDKDLINVPVLVYNLSNVLVGQTYTAADGVYDFPLNPSTYHVHIDTTAMPYVAQCQYPGIDSITSFTVIDTNVNFSLTCKSGFDVGVQSVVETGMVFPGLQHDLSIVAGDMSQWYNLACANGDSGTVQIDITGPVTFLGVGSGALTPNVISGNMFTYQIANYGAITNTTAFNLLLKTDTNAKAGDTICVNITVTPRADNNPTNNTYQYCYYVVNSHDPNLKTVYPVNVAPDYHDWFTYTIHFQNTGSSMAKNITIKDNLDSKLDISTFQLTNYSFPNTTKISGRTLTVLFSNINLPDSTVSPKTSSGFIQYRIKPKTGLPNGTIIRNTGLIYFDFNAPIYTNTTENIFSLPQPIDTSKTILNYIATSVFPNPNSGTFTLGLEYGQGPCTIAIFNVLGQSIYNGILNATNTQINLTGKEAGIYIYAVTNSNSVIIAHGKIILD